MSKAKNSKSRTILVTGGAGFIGSLLIDNLLKKGDNIVCIDNLNELGKGLNKIINKESLIIIEFPYLLDMINKGLFDLIYHEHLSYFALTPLKFLFNKFGIKIVNFERLNLGASGPAIRLFLAKNKSIYPSSKKVMKQIKYEKMWGINKMKRYNFFRKKT